MKTTRIQLEFAHRLASAHGHAWAAVVGIRDTDFESGEDLIDIDDLVGLSRETAEQRIHEAAVKNRPYWPGITTPQWDADGDIWHQTGTGRLTWLIRPDGAFTITVWRPHDIEVCGADVAPNGKVQRVTADSGRCLIRHIDVLAEALSAACEADLSDLRLMDLAEVTEVAIDNSRREVADLAERLRADAERLWHRLGELADALDEPVEAQGLSPAMMAWMQAEFGDKTVTP